jgi:hypothetical protein|tara:strand:+ start:787 stop:1095 length:309 start_codon:yes stop_codon:yes gene_type:complete
MNEPLMEEEWIIFGYDKHDLELFVYRMATRPDPVKFALDIMKEKYDNYDEGEWYDRAGDPLSDAIHDAGPNGWIIEANYDGTIEGMKIQAKKLSSINNYIWE